MYEQVDRQTYVKVEIAIWFKYVFNGSKTRISNANIVNTVLLLKTA